MPLTNSQYDEIIRAYDARQLKNEHDREERTRYACLLYTSDAADD